MTAIARKRRVCRTRLEIIQLGTKMIIEEGYSKTSALALSKNLGISTGNLTFHFPTKEHLLLELVKFMGNFHQQCIRERREQGFDEIHAYCWEVASQIALCEGHEQAKDFYVSAYSHPMTLDYIKEWTVKKNMELFAHRLPEWSEQRFANLEHITSGIEYAALLAPCSEKFTLRDKIILTLDSLLRLYNVDAEERERAIEESLTVNYLAAGSDILKNFTTYVERLTQEALDENAPSVRNPL
ncbi:MAG: TetR/AcrR family transcriptional regulator [Ruminococcaceae bacterium]|nr:TetR/AcrR family transcriptional regulator [Oscillospiraceae bacterium]